ncbi:MULTISPECIES: FAD-dependent oxidoreductase [unclassified Sporosarcina]|uniref:FAD-dependent oxidoreductase n=1 Tax=unclassified Sporosarcina TaxID=2647733 RepID=UPI000C171E3E|nr:MULTISPECIES: FAD-dependent oxidoreductase [unclassified Sporosarcina]PID07278.1 pyridine nucleotide-disulfide oxidoreductase [Sporosarcina sp. P30]PID10474.1 pyridine nucleotide-disulfide oxidoreductase [Sporosarcina sp. P31]PID13059.1 pyridine nucleotide-disulfide oxidoreductase [Sporosarcina sp. P32b]
MKIVVIGGVAGGASTAARIRRMDEQAEIIMFEKGPHVSFSNCSLPFYLSGIVEDSNKLVLMDPVAFKNKYNIEARVSQEVIAINRKEKTVSISHVLTGETYEESYDRLVLSPGASPIVPNLEGVDSKHVFTVRNVEDIERLNNYVQTKDIANIAVIGGGFIGVEVAENLKLAGRNVSLIEFANQVMMPFDYDMAQILHKELMDKGIKVIVNDGLAKITDNNVTLNSGKQVDAQVVVLANGVRPETKLAKDADLEIGELGGIKVDANYRTSDKSIYAVGDAIEVYHQLLHKPTRLALAGPAQRQARAAADHMYGIPHQNKGVIGSSSIQIFDLVAASTGLNEKLATSAGIQHDSVYIIAPDKVALMPNSNPLHFKLVFEVPTGKILGAQAIGKGNADKRIDVIATLISMGGTLEDLKELELTYSPMYSTAKDVVNLAALVALNILYGRYEQVHVSEVRGLVEQNAVIIDVREENEFAKGHLVNAVNIPLSQLRDRMEEVPKDVPVYVHCRSSQRSYNALMALQNSGFDNIVNISGSFLGICLYEYFNDVNSDREKIVTEYNFN